MKYNVWTDFPIIGDKTCVKLLYIIRNEDTRPEVSQSSIKLYYYMVSVGTLQHLQLRDQFTQVPTNNIILIHF